MTPSTLIARCAKEIFDASPTAIGVRLCPIALSADELVEAVSELRALLGPSVFIVGSAPEAALRDEERLFIAHDQRAAERATEWRNQVRVDSGERLVYLSVEEHGKAGGLRDCLVPIQESDLVRSFLDWSAAPGSGLPPDFAHAVREAGLHERASVGALCEFVSGVAAEPARVSKWTAVGRNLPILGLVRDTALGDREEEVAQRLASNARIVKGVAAGEQRRRSTVAPVAEVEAKIQQALVGGRLVRDALRAVDLGAASTEEILPPRAPKRSPALGKKKARGPSAARKPKPARSSRSRKGATGSDRPSPELEVVIAEPEAPIASVGVNTPEQPERQPPPRPRPTGARVSAAPLPTGLGVLMEELLQSGGDSITATVRGRAREALSSLPRSTPVTRSAPLEAQRALEGPLTRWREARAALLDRLGSTGLQDRGAVLTRALGKLVGHATVRDSIDALHDAALALYAAAGGGSLGLLREVLALDTALLADSAGPSLRIIGPLHMLSLAQALARANEGAEDPPAQRRDVERQRPLIAPASWPEGAQLELGLSRPVEGLVVYERDPETLSSDALRSAGALLLERYEELCPFALGGCRVVVLGARAGELAAGFSEHLAGESRFERIEVLCEQPPDLSASGAITQQLEAGRLDFSAAPTEPSALQALQPNLVVHIRAGAPAAADEEPARPAPHVNEASVGAFRSRFELRERGLRIRTSVVGVPGLEAFDNLHAGARERVPIGEFVSEASGVSLRTMPLERGSSTTWHALIAPSLATRPPMGSYLLVHERLDATAACAVISREVRPATRAVKDGLGRMGVLEERPSFLKTLASRLASVSGGGLISLRRSSDRLLAGGLLSIELLRRAPDAVVLEVAGPSYETLLRGEEEESSASLQVALSVARGRVRVIIGYASLAPQPQIEFGKSSVTGTSARRLAALAEALEHSARSDSPRGRQARDALDWLVWPSLASQDPADRPAELIAALSGVELQLALEEVVCLLPQSVKAPKGSSPKVAGTPVSVVPLDLALIKRSLLGSTVDA